MNKTNLKKHNTLFLLLLLSVVLFLAALLSLFFGGTMLHPKEIFEGLFGTDRALFAIMHGIRLPRMLGGILAGMGLSVSGVLLQTVTDNALASPNVIGVNSGAGLTVILLLAFAPGAVTLLPLAAFLGAFGAALLIVGTAKRFGNTPTAVVLMGVAVSALFNAAISFVTLLDTDVVSAYNYFSIGGLSGVRTEELLLPSILILVSLLLALLLAPLLETLRLGDSMAKALGMRTFALRTAALVCAAASAAAVVSFAGLLGFVGLVVPHVARRIIGERIRPLLLASALMGGILVLLADLCGRTLFSPTEVPVGILMALIGAPFFLFLLIRRRHHA